MTSPWWWAGPFPSGADTVVFGSGAAIPETTRQKAIGAARPTDCDSARAFRPVRLARCSVDVGLQESGPSTTHSRFRRSSSPAPHGIYQTAPASAKADRGSCPHQADSHQVLVLAPVMIGWRRAGPPFALVGRTDTGSHPSHGSTRSPVDNGVCLIYVLPKIFNWRKTGNYASNPLDRVFSCMLSDSRADSSVAPEHDFAGP
jgi:hypothetical protein